MGLFARKYDATYSLRTLATILKVRLLDVSLSFYCIIAIALKPHFYLMLHTAPDSPGHF